jgi:hypothetical protein
MGRSEGVVGRVRDRNLDAVANAPIKRGNQQALREA